MPNLAHTTPMITPTSIRDYLVGDYARPSETWSARGITLASVPTGRHLTFRVSRPPGSAEGRPFLVSVLSGPDNQRDYTYVAALDVSEQRAALRLTAKSPGPGSDAVQAFGFFTRQVLDRGVLPEALRVLHHGRCGRCGRKLTTPESIRLGLGPVCVTRS